MPTPISKVLGVSHENLVAQGAFDGFVDVDSRLYVDPHLLHSTKAPALAGARERFRDYFANVIRVLQAAHGRHPAFRAQATRLLTFREVPNTGLGYAKADIEGSAIGPRLARALTNLAVDILAAGIDDPDIFELVGLLQEGIGADRISDMTVWIILPELLRFTEQVARSLEVATQRRTFRQQAYDLPINPRNNRIIVLIPQDILRDLPVAESWADIDTVSSQNAALRARVNPIIGSSWRHATRRVTKAAFRDTVLKHPDLLRDLLHQYKKKPAVPYDFATDPAAQQLWFYLSQEQASKYPLDLSHYAPVTADKVAEVVRQICDRFKALVEDNRLSRILYNDDGTRRHERIAQLGFFAVADAYCHANDLDLSPEANAGIGPVDFKISGGYESRVNVEIKLSSNPHLVDGFTTQLPLYNKAEKAKHSFLLAVRVDDNLHRINEVQRVRQEWLETGKRAPELIIIDGRQRPSASKT